MTDQEQAELMALKRAAPFRQWCAIKFANEPAIYFDSVKKARAYWRKRGGPATLYQTRVGIEP